MDIPSIGVFSVIASFASGRSVNRAGRGLEEPRAFSNAIPPDIPRRPTRFCNKLPPIMACAGKLHRRSREAARRLSSQLFFFDGACFFFEVPFLAAAFFAG